MEQTIDERIQARLDSWALKYDVPREQHLKYSAGIKPLLKRLYNDVSRGETPRWMDTLKCSGEDSFTKALNMAEQSYSRMYETSQNYEKIRTGIIELGSNVKGLDAACNTLRDLASDVKAGFERVQDKFEQCSKETYKK